MINKLVTNQDGIYIVVSFALVYQVMKTIDLNTAYAVWAGLGLVVVREIKITFKDLSLDSWRFDARFALICIIRFV